MSIKIKSFRKSDENRPLAIFSMLFLSYKEISEQLDSIMKFVSRLTATGFDEMKLDRRGRLLLTCSRVANAIKALNVVLGRPPTVAEVAEVSGEDRQRVTRLLRGDYTYIGTEILPFGVSLENCSESGLTVWRRSVGKEVESVVLPKRIGRPKKGFKRNVGRPSKVVKVLEKPSSLEVLWQQLDVSERSKLEAYLKSKPFVDMVREVYVKLLSLLWFPLNHEKIIEKWAVPFFKSIGQRALRVAERCNSPHLTPDLRWYYSFDWMLQGLKAYSQIPKDKLLPAINSFIELIKTMPDEDFASLFIIAPFKAGTLKA